jgi:DNA replication and repair protein RecF
MPLGFVELHNLRLIERAATELHPTRNVIIGPNASGKTSFLEGIFLLGTGRSFRTGQLGHLLRRGASVLRVMGRVTDAEGHVHSIGMQREGSHRLIKVDEHAESSVAPLAALLPIIVIAPETHYAFLHEADARRATLNWGLFHVEPAFLGEWRTYHRLLRQRNSALKQRRSVTEVTAWDRELAVVGERLQAWRADYVTRWSPRFRAYAHTLLDTTEAELRLLRGWPEELSFSEALAADRERDREAGFTYAGPHRADLQVRLLDAAARTHSSHGQQKLLVMALRFAQLDLVPAKHGVLLVDDLPAELDRDRRHRVLQTLNGLAAQVFLTATEEDGLVGGGVEQWVFHVERGALQPGADPHP